MPIALNSSGVPNVRDREGRCAWILPTIIDSGENSGPAPASRECLSPRAKSPAVARALPDRPVIDRPSMGPVPATRLTWDHPHEGNRLTDFDRRPAFRPARGRAAAV